MTRQEIIKLLEILFDDVKLSDDDIFEIIYSVMEQIENTCYGYADSVYNQRFTRIYKRMFEEVFQDLINDHDSFDEMINNALSGRNKQIVNLEEK